MKYLINKETRVLDCLILVDNYSYDSNCLELVETNLKTTHLVNKWNGYEWVEDATQEEMDEALKLNVPETISRMSLKIQLLLLKGIEISDIVKTIESIPNTMFSEISKKVAIIKLENANFFERYDADFNLIGTLAGLNQEDLDNIFINGNIS